MHRIELVFIIGQRSMESARKYQLLLQVVALLIVSFSWSCAGINQTYYVGGNRNALYTWFDPTTEGDIGSTSYQDWADSITYDDTDTLLFTYNSSLHNVLFVPSQAELDSCSYNESTVVFSDQSGDTSVFFKNRVSGASTWYVFSSWLSSDCSRGMKFSIVVQGTLVEASSPAESPGYSISSVPAPPPGPAPVSPPSTPSSRQSPSPGASPGFSPPAPPQQALESRNQSNNHSTVVPQIIINWATDTNFDAFTVNLTDLTVTSYIGFVFNDKTYQVVQVGDKQHYEDCDTSSPSDINPDILSGQRINLPSPGNYYFIDHNYQNCNASKLKLTWTLVGDATSGSPASSRKSSVNLLAIAIPSAIGGLVLLCAVMGFMFCLRRRKSEDSRASVGGPGSSVVDWARRQEAIKGILEGQKGSNTCKIYTYKELDEATNHFASDNKLGSGAFGTVYKGTMSKGTVVAIKRTNNGGTDLEQFLNEVSILSQVNNRHLVKLLGCCVELDVPLLVYEFISNGTVQDHLVVAREGYATKLDWAMRFRIAIQTAEALKYLHVQAEPPIFHRDVKSANILLDDNFNAKVADFGLSKLVDMDATHVSTVVKGTPGYLDPEYYHSFQLTDKTDVYSFGVVLLELITSRKPVDLSLEPGLQHLGMASIPLIRSGRTREIIDKTLISESLTGDDYVIIEGCAEIAAACLGSDRASRPSMSEVVEMLRGLNSTTPTAQNFWAKSSSTGSRVRGIEMENNYDFLFSQSSVGSSSQGTSSSGSQVESRDLISENSLRPR